MSGRRRFAALLVAVLASIAALLTGAAASSAAPGYTHGAHISLSATNVNGCGHLTVTGTDFAPNETVTLTLHTKTYVLGTVQTDASGNFSKVVDLPLGVNGSHTITATGTTHDKSSAKLTISNCADTGGVSTGGGGTSITGVAVIGISVLGLLLIGAGLLLVISGRRRRALG